MTVACKASGGLVVVAIAVGLAGEAALAARRARFREALARACAGGLDHPRRRLPLVPGRVPLRVRELELAGREDQPVVPLCAGGAACAAPGKGDRSTLLPVGFCRTRVWDPLKNLIVWQLGIAIGIAALVGMVAMGVTVANAIVAHVRKSDSRALGEERLAGLTLFATDACRLRADRVLLRRHLLCAHRPLPLAAHTVRRGCGGVCRLLLRNSPALLPVAAVLLTASLLTTRPRLPPHLHQPTTRVAASSWIVQHVPAGSTIVNENWDDSLPVGSDAQRFKGVTLPVFDADDDAKLRKLYDGLSGADYYFVSSPRAWRTIGRFPRRFPIMSRYYRQLFAGRLGFTEIAHFAVEPGLFGVQLHDVGAEEAFWNL